MRDSLNVIEVRDSRTRYQYLVPGRDGLWARPDWENCWDVAAAAVAVAVAVAVAAPPPPAPPPETILKVNNG